MVTNNKNYGNYGNYGNYVHYKLFKVLLAQSGNSSRPAILVIQVLAASTVTGIHTSFINTPVLN